MREILFRGKDRKTGEWVYGYYYTQNEYHCIRNDNERPENIDCVVEPEMVGQFTGLTDKNGTKIFEGDIVIEHRQGRVTTKPTCGVVCWDNELSRLILKTSDEVRAFINPYWFDKISYEIIGNIWDNTELMEKTE